MPAAVVVQRYSGEDKHEDFVCRDCLGVFPTARDFSDHFIRERFMIVGCRGAIAEIPAAAEGTVKR